MSQSLISSLTAGLGSRTINRVAADTGASEEKIVSGFRAAMAAILGGIVKKADDPNGMRQVFELLTGGISSSLRSASEFNRDASSTDPGSHLVEPGQRLLSTIFGPSQSSVVQAISDQSDLPSDVVVQIIDMSAAMVLSLLGRRVKDQEISLSEFPNLLFREAGDVSSYLPVSVHNLLRTATTTLESSPAGVASVPKEPTRNGGRILAVCLISALLVGISWLIRQSHPDAGTVVPEQGVSRSRARVSAIGGFVERELPGGIRMNIPENGMESKLISYIEDSARNAGREQWFDFDRLTFEKSSAIPRSESEEQLANLASILKAYPQVRLKVGGYTDNSGNRRANQRLSENQAESVRRELVGMGVAASRLEAEGYGDQHTIADNITEQGRAKNNRISVKVLQK
jgi:OmpA-OmpF porin, OOP family